MQETKAVGIHHYFQDGFMIVLSGCPDDGMTRAGDGWTVALGDVRGGLHGVCLLDAAAAFGAPSVVASLLRAPCRHHHHGH